jgi:VanZ family protein
MHRFGLALRSPRIAIILLVFWTGLVWGQGFVPGTRFPSTGVKVSDAMFGWCTHVGLHAALMFVAWRVARFVWRERQAVAVALVFSLVNAVLAELSQQWLPGRHADLLEVSLNVAGVFLAAWWILRRHSAAVPTGSRASVAGTSVRR